MERGIGGDTEPADIPCVLGDPRLYENDMKHSRTKWLSSRTIDNVIDSLRECGSCGFVERFGV